MPFESGAGEPPPTWPARAPFESLWLDLRQAVRALRRNPLMLAVALVSLAVGIGANCAAFTWADTLLLRPLTVDRPDEVVTVGSTASIEGLTSGLSASYPEYVDLRTQATSFKSLAAFTWMNAALATSPDALPQMTGGTIVSGNFFAVMGVVPELGRAFRPDEDEVPGRDAVIVLSHTLWTQRFGAEQSILGRRVRLKGVEFTVIGIAPETFTGMEQFARSDFYIPLMMWPRLSDEPNVMPLETRELRALVVKGRLTSGIDLTRAQRELDVLAKRWELAYPDTSRSRTLKVRTELQVRMANWPIFVTLLAMLTTLSAAVLFVACSNVAALLVSRAPARAREMAVRMSLGAARARLIRQLMTESLLMAVAGALLGLVAGYASVRMFQHIQVPTDLPVTLTFQLDRRVLFVSLNVAAVSALLFGLAPAIRTSRVELTSVLKGAESSTRHGRTWGRGVLVAGQVAVSVVLLVLATFTYRGFRQALGNPGYRLDHLLMMSFDPSLVRYQAADARRFFERLVERVRSMPGVNSAALASTVPMQMVSVGGVAIAPEGYQLPAGRENVALLSAVVDEHYLETMQIRLVRGRGFLRTDDSPASPLVAVINEQVAEHYWPGQDAIGKRFRLFEGGTPSWVEIVGVTKTTKYFFLLEPPTEFVYLPYRQHPQSRMILLVETAGAPAAFAAPIRASVRDLDANQPIYDVRTMEEFYQAGTVSTADAIVGTIGAMGMMALGLSIVGLYGLVAYAASRRTREIGIRIAIGADRGAIIRMVLGHGMGLATAGLVTGLIASLAMQRLLLAAFPGGDNRSDPVSLLVIAPIVLAATSCAAFIPAHRASRVDPIDALRYE